MALNINEGKEINFLGKSRLAMMVSAILCALVIIGMPVLGFNWGVDFAGGSEIEVGFNGSVDAASVRKVVEGAGFNDVLVQEADAAENTSAYFIRIGRISMLTQEDAAKAKAAVDQKFGGDIASFTYNPNYGDKFDIRFQKGKSEGKGEALKAAIESTGIAVRDIHPHADGFSVITHDIAAEVSNAFVKAGKSGKAELKAMENADIRRVDFVGPQVGEQLRNQGILAVLYAAMAILLYVAFRFELRFAPGAVIALIHDVIIILGYYLVFRREFNLTTVAVLLSIVGYSINDTIVIYDRIRENLGKLRGRDLAAVMNTSINQNLTRTILTTATTLVAIAPLIVFGVGQLFDFAMAMILGILIGTYSSIFIAIPLSLRCVNLGKVEALEAPKPAA